MPIPYSAVSAMISGDHLKVYNMVLENKEAEEKAMIKL